MDGLAHCGACHTPKTIFGGDQLDQYLQGARLQGWSAPDITNNTRVGLGQWTAEDIARYLKTGRNRFTAATGPMAEVVELSTSRMTDADTRAIATYLKTLSGKSEETKPRRVDAKVLKVGATIYRDQCSACHGIEGKGVPHLFSALNESAMVRSDDPTSVIRMVLRGARSAGTEAEPTAPGMPSYGLQLDDNQIAAVLNFIRNGWGAGAPPIDAKDVNRVRSETAMRSD